MSADMEAALSKIRPHTSSSLAHQKAPANLLVALEATFKEQNAECTPAAYFAGLITALESTVKKEEAEGKFTLGDADVLPAELYLLALVGPFVPAPIIRSRLNTLLALTAPLWPALNAYAPPLRSQLTLYNAILRALDRAQLSLQGVRQSFATILQLCVDSRPKVRKRAVELVRDVLASPPSPLVRHPYSVQVGEWSVNALTEVNAIGTSKQKGKKNSEEVVSATIHLLAFIRPVLPFISPDVLPTITASLLTLPRLGNPYLSQSAYGVLSDLLSVPEDPTVPRNIDTSTSELLKAILSTSPLKTDVTLLPPWVQVVGKIMLVYSSSEPEACTAELPKVWKTIFPFLESTDPATRRETTEALACLTQCITPALVDSALTSSDSKNALHQIIAQVTKALDSLAYARSTPELLFVISSLIMNMRYRPEGQSTPTAAERLLTPLITNIGDKRIEKGFEYKEAADGVLRTAMTIIGPEALLKALPLNLEPEDRVAGREPRAFLLPLLVHPHPSPLGHFISYFVPLTERMFDLQQKAEAEGRASEGKVWSVLVSQIWNGLPAYCYQTPDLRESLTPQFAQMLSQLLYSQPELRPPVLRALKVVVDSNAKARSSASSSDRGVDVEKRPEALEQLLDEEIAKNLAYLRSQSESWFAVLFNVFGTVGKDGQGMVGEVISTWASISDEKEVAKTCKKVVEFFKSHLNKMTSSSNRSASASDDERGIVASMQDILILLVPFLSKNDAQTVFDLSLAPEVLKNKDNGVQKRAYKLLSKIIATGKIEVDAETLFAKMDEVADDTLAAAKKDRMAFFKALLPSLPSTSLHVIPSLIPEAVLGTKEPSEKARIAAFDLVVAMGYKMKDGGVVKRHKLNGMEEDDATEASANISEYFTMMAGGLAGATPHMISATITAISRLAFEFKDDIPAQMHSEIFQTLIVFLTSANREIVKSTLGFVKLSIHTLPVGLLRPHLKELVHALLKWSHDHKNHFKAKVRHIFERMIRRFGWDDVYACVGEEEAGKVLLNIKKRKERAKRKKSQHEMEGEDEEDDVPAAKATTGDAFEDVLYGSESELDESDEEYRASHEAASKKKGKGRDMGARIRMDDDDPVDLLHGASARITNARKLTRKQGSEASKFKTDEETGKIVFNTDTDTDTEIEPDENARLGGSAYRESMMSVDGFTRDTKGRVKFNKDTKKRRRENEEAGLDDDVDMVDAIDNKHKKIKRKGSVKLGHEFKAKKAGGDVKKGGVDPYAYLPLSQAAKGGKGRGGQKFTVTGKR